MLVPRKNRQKPMSTSIKDYTSFSCPNSKCKLYNQCGLDNITHHSWIGKIKNIRRLRCRECKKAFSENRGTLRERAKIDEAKQERLLKCFRWGVCEEGTADICEVNVKTVQLFRSKAAKQAQMYHETEVKEVKAAGVQLDEIRVKQAGKITWAAVAIAMGSFLILGLSVGKRTQGLADQLLAQVWGRCQLIGIFLSDGWSCYFNAILRCCARLYKPRSKQRGRKLAKRLKFDRSSAFYGQVIKQTKDKFRLCAIRCKALIGTMSECLFFIKTYELGNKIHTSHIERWFGTLRCHIASLRRKSRCFGKCETILSERIWIFIWFHNWTLTHDSLTINGIKRTPAMVAGLSEHPLTYRDLIHLRVKENWQLRERIQTKLKEMQSKEVMDAAKRTKRPRGQESVIWKAPPQGKQRKAA